MIPQTLLLLGVSNDTRTALEYAKRTGVHTIVTDYNPPERCPEKLLADEYWMIDLKDMDALEAKCREVGVNGVYAGNNEFCLDRVKELTHRLGLPFYASEDGWDCARDKALFKEACIRAGVNVPRRYPLSRAMEDSVLTQVEYPVIVKPVDACASRGISICQDEEQLRAGYQLALENSQSGDIIVEDFITGQEMTVNYCIEDGEAKLLSIIEIHACTMDGKRTFFGACTNRCSFLEDFLEKADPGIRRLLKDLGCRNGHVFVQGIKRGRKYYFFEMGYRLDGLGTWIIEDSIYGCNSLEKMVDLALGRPIAEYWTKKSIDIGSKTGLTYLMGSRTGKIEHIEGLDEVLSVDGVHLAFQRFHEGEMQSYTSSMLQAAFLFIILAENPVQSVEKLRYINETLHMKDENGREMLLPFLDYDALLNE